MSNINPSEEALHKLIHHFFHPVMLGLAAHISLEKAMSEIVKKVEAYRADPSEHNKTLLFASATIIAQKGMVEKILEVDNQSEQVKAELKQKNPSAN